MQGRSTFKAIHILLETSLTQIFRDAQKKSPRKHQVDSIDQMCYNIGMKQKKQMIANQDQIEHLIANQDQIAVAEHLPVFEQAHDELQAEMTERERIYRRSKRWRFYAHVVTIRNRLRQAKEKQDAR